MLQKQQYVNGLVIGLFLGNGSSILLGIGTAWGVRIGVLLGLLIGYIFDRRAKCKLAAAPEIIQE